ncbi:serine/threonine protein kinase [Nannizzia gypsea CBS 118893]|uniref:Serine/threonine protein kinase n=1 Tax=Arthroderma gypseum (strain ATCC MYA-4604 / CBS 118893) TaxID=535722 RepID=E4USB0_ARTGP|nr:serine/threonine protein kinase [Nannizzia gypsea CBS 118893]EFR01314.1 serine/threonine protein kinase [Nannizzia gypsea CBS 118893]
MASSTHVQHLNRALMIPIKRKEGIGFGVKANIHRASATIVVKVPNSEALAAEKEPFLEEAKFYNRLFEEKEKCLDIVECFVALPDFIFLSYCCNDNLARHFFNYQEREVLPYGSPGKLISVKQYEDPALIARWIRQLASALAFVEKLGYTHNDQHLANCLLDENMNLKLCDFDRATTIGQYLESFLEPWAVMITSGPLSRTYGLSSARTEQFAVGTFLYTMVYGHEPYEDIHLRENDPDELCRRFRASEFPELNRHEVFDGLISACWHNVYPTMALLDYDFKRKTKDIASPATYPAIDYAKEKRACIAMIQSGLLGPEYALSYQPAWQRCLHGFLGKFLFIWKRTVNFLGLFFHK